VGLLRVEFGAKEDVESVDNDQDVSLKLRVGLLRVEFGAKEDVESINDDEDVDDQTGQLQ